MIFLVYVFRARKSSSSIFTQCIRISGKLPKESMQKAGSTYAVPLNPQNLNKRIHFPFVYYFKGCWNLLMRAESLKLRKLISLVFKTDDAMETHLGKSHHGKVIITWWETSNCAVFIFLLDHEICPYFRGIATRRRLKAKIQTWITIYLSESSPPYCTCILRKSVHYSKKKFVSIK